MAKFYVKCGEFENIVTADTVRKAAIWAMHLTMEELLPIDDLDWVECDGLAVVKYESGFMPLESVIKISERGFGRDEAARFSTEEILKEWNQLLVAVAKLERMFENESEQ